MKVRNLIAKSHSNPARLAGQSATVGGDLPLRRIRSLTRPRGGPPERVWCGQGAGTPFSLAALVILVVCLIALGGAGCCNLYRQTQSIYPADSGDLLQMRIEEAQQAEQRANQASATLHERLAVGVNGPDLKPDLDRFEVAAHDFMRRVASARDAMRYLKDGARFEAEMERLEQRAIRMQESVHTVRQMEAAGSDDAAEHDAE